MRLCRWCNRPIEPHHAVTIKDHGEYHTWVCLDEYTAFMRLFRILGRQPSKEELNACLAHVRRVGHVPSLEELSQLDLALPQAS